MAANLAGEVGRGDVVALSHGASLDQGQEFVLSPDHRTNPA